VPTAGLVADAGQAPAPAVAPVTAAAEMGADG
jgi:hypothetical protein